MFDGLDCCGFDEHNDGDYDDYLDIAPGETGLCTECLCKGISKFKHGGLYRDLHGLRNHALV